MPATQTSVLAPAALEPGAFPPEATRFLAGLAADNSRDYWQANREVFERAVKAPMAGLLDELSPAYGPFHVFRMQRDLRFSADKAPYKTMHGAAEDRDGAVRYVHVDATGLLVAVGAYLLDSAQLDRYRRAVADDASGPALEAALAAAHAAGLTTGPGGAAPLATAPRGYPRDHPRIALLRQKGTIAHTTLPADSLGDGTAVLGAVRDAFAAAEPLHRWIVTHVGAGARRST